MMKNHKKSLLALVLLGLFGLSACTFDGDDGKDGADGAPGTPGADGQNGQDGQDAGSAVSAVYNAGDVAFTIEPADNTLAGTGTFALKFKVTAKDQAGAEKPLSGVSRVAVYSTTAMPNTTGDSPATVWVNNGADGAHSMYCTLDGTYSSSDACTLAEDPTNPGTYTGTWSHDGVAPIMNANDDLNAPHRVFLRIYDLKDATDATKNISGKVLSQPLDYVPATGALVESTGKDTVADAACIQCHGKNAKGTIANISAHGNYESVKNCIACHNPATQPTAAEAAEGWVYDLPAMIHRIHAGAHIAKDTVAYNDGTKDITMGDLGFVQTEDSVNSRGGISYGWSGIEYPSPVTECTVCHSNDEGKTSWKDQPSRAACSGCHSNIDFATGANHSEYKLAQTDDSQCAGCHATGPISPVEAHKVGKRAQYASLVKVDFTGASVSGGDGAKVLTVTADITVNGALSSDLSVLGVTSTLMGNVDDAGEVHRWTTRPALTSTSGNFNAGVGKLTLTQAITDTQAKGTIYVGTEATFCVDTAGKAATCDETADLAYGNPVEVVHEAPVYSTAIGVTSTVKFFDLDTPAADDTGVKARFVEPAHITVAEAKCNACHNSLDIAKGAGHGVYTFDQCMDCHNNDYPGSYHPTTNILTIGIKDGKPAVTEATTGSAVFHNRDLVTVAHRFHSGNMNGDNTTELAGVFRDSDGVVHGYPAPSSDCSVCHKDGAKLFAEDGGLTSGKRSIAVTGGYISPVAESCRSCHTSGAALAHFKSNGATTDDAPDSTADLPIESCSTCHAQGKSYGIDKFHIMK